MYKYWWICFGRVKPRRILLEKAPWGEHSWLMENSKLGEEKIVVTPGQDIFETPEAAVRKELRRLKQKERYFKERIKLLGKQLPPSKARSS